VHVLANITGSVDKLFFEIGAFLASIAAKGITFTEKDKACMILIIFPRAFGPSSN